MRLFDCMRSTVVCGFAAATLSLGATSAYATEMTYSAQHPLKVALVLHGNLGDKSFFDSADAGLKKAATSLPVAVRTIEAGLNRSNWEPALSDAAEGDYDVIIAGSYEMVPFISELAPSYPDKKFILFDDHVDYATGKFKNVLSIDYRTSTASYLAGYVAAKSSKTATIGEILGNEASVILEFAVGFEQGARAANPAIKIIRATVNSSTPFNDPAKGKELALAQIQQGADVIFPIAGGTGIGALQAAKDKAVLGVGVDSDQAQIFADTDPKQAAAILTSVEKRVGQSLFLALKDTVEGKARYGAGVMLGVQDGAVGISKNKWYDALVSSDTRAEVDREEAKIAAGELKVTTAMGN